MEDPDLEVNKQLYKDIESLMDQRSGKIGFYLPLKNSWELLDELGMEAEQSNLPRPNLVAEDTYSGGGRKMSASSVMTTMEKSRQRSASSPVMTEASSVARVWARQRGE